MLLLIAGLVLFLGIHLLPAFPGLRVALLGRWPEQRYKAGFSVVSGVGLVLIVVGYAMSEQRERLFAPLPAAIAIAPYAMTISLILFAAANMRTHIRQVVKHPMLLGLLIWSLVHLLANGDLKGTVLFGAFLAYAALDLASAIQRQATKSFVPTARHDLIAVVAGIAVALLVMTFHRVLFGVAVVRFGV